MVSLSHWGVWGPGLSSSCRPSYLLKRSWPGLLRGQTSARSFPLCDIAKVGADLQAPFLMLYSQEFWAKAGSSSTSLVWLRSRKAWVVVRKLELSIETLPLGPRLLLRPLLWQTVCNPGENEVYFRIYISSAETCKQCDNVLPSWCLGTAGRALRA